MGTGFSWMHRATALHPPARKCRTSGFGIVSGCHVKWCVPRCNPLYERATTTRTSHIPARLLYLPSPRLVFCPARRVSTDNCGPLNKLLGWQDRATCPAWKRNWALNEAPLAHTQLRKSVLCGDCHALETRLTTASQNATLQLAMEANMVLSN